MRVNKYNERVRVPGTKRIMTVVKIESAGQPGDMLIWVKGRKKPYFYCSMITQKDIDFVDE